MTSRRGLRIAVSLALPVVLGFLATLAHAQPTFTVGTTSVTPNPVRPGVSITITTSITNTSAMLASGIIVDEEIYDAAGVKVNQGTTSGQQYTPGQTFQAGETRAFQWFWTIPPTLPAATYTVKIGVFQDHWTQGPGAGGSRASRGASSAGPSARLCTAGVARWSP